MQSEADLQKTASNLLAFLEKQRKEHLEFVEEKFTLTATRIKRYLAEHASLNEDDVFSGKAEIDVPYKDINIFCNIIFEYLGKENRMSGDLTGQGDLSDRLAFLVVDGRSICLETLWKQGAASVFRTDFTEWRNDLAVSFDELRAGVERMLRSPINPLEG